jgi:hypothetical protein
MWPQCTQCTRLGRACPGTSAGLIFINTRVDPGPLEPLKDPHAHKVQSISTAGDITSVSLEQGYKARNASDAGPI